MANRMAAGLVNLPPLYTNLHLTVSSSGNRNTNTSKLSGNIESSRSLPYLVRQSAVTSTQHQIPLSAREEDMVSSGNSSPVNVEMPNSFTALPHSLAELESQTTNRLEAANSSAAEYQQQCSSTLTHKSRIQSRWKRKQFTSSPQQSTTPLPIDRLKIHGKSSQSSAANRLLSGGDDPDAARDSTMTLHTTQVTLTEGVDASTAAPTLQGSSKLPTPAKRYEFIRRQMRRSDTMASPTFVIEGKKVSRMRNTASNQVTTENGGMANMVAGPDFDPIAFLESRGASRPMKSTANFTRARIPDQNTIPSKNTTHHQSGHHSACSSVSVVLPMLYIEGPNSSHQLRSKSTSLPAEECFNNNDMEITASEQGHGHIGGESICSELENLDSKNQRLVKKNNFFNTTGSRVGEDFSDLCVENSTHKSKTITLQLNNPNDRKPASNVTPAAPSSISSAPVSSVPAFHHHHYHSTSKSAASDKLYRSATQLNQLSNSISARPVFTNISSYLQFNNHATSGGSSSRRAHMYTSEVYLDNSSSRDSNGGVLKPLDNKQVKTNKKLVAKYSDIEIQKELSDFFKVCPAK